MSKNQVARAAPASDLHPSQQEFNDDVRHAIDSIIRGIVGQDVLNSLHNHLRIHYGITPEEMPYRLETLFETLEHTIGVSGARTLSKAIAREVYYRHNIDFTPLDGYTLHDYLEQAKRVLQQAINLAARDEKLVHTTLS